MVDPVAADANTGHRQQSLIHWAFMYAKTNPSAGHLSPRQKRAFAIVGVLVVLLFAGLGTWGGAGARTATPVPGTAA